MRKSNNLKPTNVHRYGLSEASTHIADNSDDMICFFPGICQNYNYFYLKNGFIPGKYTDHFTLKFFSLRDGVSGNSDWNYGYEDLLFDFCAAINGIKQEKSKNKYIVTFSFGGTLLLDALIKRKIDLSDDRIKGICLISPFAMQGSGHSSLDYRKRFTILKLLGANRFVPFKWLSFIMNGMHLDFEYYKSVNNSSISLHDQVFKKMDAASDIINGQFTNNFLLITSVNDDVCPKEEITGLTQNNVFANQRTIIFTDSNINHKNIMFTDKTHGEILEWIEKIKMS